MSNLIEVPKESIPDLVRKAYELSVPVGLGFLHATNEPLTDEQVNSLIDFDDEDPVTMDYVLGRCCKFWVMKEDEKYFIGKSWYDHSQEQHAELLKVADGYR